MITALHSWRTCLTTAALRRNRDQTFSRYNHHPTQMYKRPRTTAPASHGKSANAIQPANFARHSGDPMKPTQAPVIFQCDGPVARLIFNRPEVLNAFNRECAVALLEACRAIERNTDIRVVLMKGNGNAFMAGGDVGAFPVSAAEAPA